MADLSDVEQAVVDAVVSLLYPAGSAQSSIIGTICRVYRGWPNSSTLNADLGAGVVNITVVSDNESGKTTTRYLPQWQALPRQSGVAAQAAGQTIVISGSPASGDLVGAIIDGVTFSYRVQDGDTPSLVAANLQRLIQMTRIAHVNGASATIPGSASVIVRAVCDNTSSYESRRQEKDVRIICWCAMPAVRDSLATAIDSAIAANGFLVLSDMTKARIVYRNTISYDQSQNALLYRRDLVYGVEYATVTTVQQPSMLFGASDLNSNITYG